MRADLHQIVTFATHAFRGNPAFVLTLPQPPQTAAMQEVCALLETKVLAVLSAPTSDGFELRFYTPEGEHPGAGHAAMAAAHVAFAVRVGSDLSAREGALSFRFGDRSRRPAALSKGLLSLEWPIMPYQPATGLAELEQALGRRPVEAYVAQFGYVAVFASMADVAQLAPDMEAVAGLDRSAVIVTAPGDSSDIVIRVFAPAAGLPEDPVCGTAHRIIAPYWAERLGKAEIHSRHLSKRGGDLWCRVGGSTVAIAGRSVMTVSGSIEVPA
jgi:PhzF family phenazine biosynthesis protein